MTATHPARLWFELAADGLVATAGQITPQDLPRPGLGVWTVRDLLGHASRAFSTVVSYLAAPADPNAPWLAEPTDYFTAALRSTAAAEPAQIAERGRAAGRALGDDPVRALRALAADTRALVAATPDHASVTTPFGTMTLTAYLPTRAFELTVHGLDLARAVEVAPCTDLALAARAALSLVAALATTDQAVSALLALTGRHGLPEGFSLL
ncbi:MAG: maleylpyruvate isomerase N-terminal domain-containing protein [Austwickia sp.]|jgi:uncharacterized protein (TIGR03083 family)|nr:maleylpyruvate isomerase N-terminal domain-containing protein [Austwickia sp.]MBK8436600.1 maleylpyruvate isomerase N-terminal domain-containing protein [Austwickia sp.]MBK9102265.1 maleylpyruvate isomerase N-terminal domain-containing protein [Austwickia sp.]